MSEEHLRSPSSLPVCSTSLEQDLKIEMAFLKVTFEGDFQFLLNTVPLMASLSHNACMTIWGRGKERMDLLTDQIRTLHFVRLLKF